MDAISDCGSDGSLPSMEETDSQRDTPACLGNSARRGDEIRHPFCHQNCQSTSILSIPLIVPSHHSLAVQAMFYSTRSQWERYYKFEVTPHQETLNQHEVVALLFRTAWDDEHIVGQAVHAAWQINKTVSPKPIGQTGSIPRYENMHRFLQLLVADRLIWALDSPKDVDHRPVLIRPRKERRVNQKLEPIVKMHITWDVTLRKFIADWKNNEDPSSTSVKHVQSLIDGLKKTESTLSVVKAEQNFCQAALGLYGLAQVNTSQVITWCLAYPAPEKEVCDGKLHPA